MRYRPQAKVYFLFFVVACLLLGLCGHHEPGDQIIRGLTTITIPGDYDLNTFVWLSRVSTAYYFAWFLLITPILGLRETPLPVPESISTPVLSHPAAAPAGAPAAPEKKG